jgi:hypothetical protein
MLVEACACNVLKSVIRFYDLIVGIEIGWELSLVNVRVEL